MIIFFFKEFAAKLNFYFCSLIRIESTFSNINYRSTNKKTTYLRGSTIEDVLEKLTHKDTVLEVFIGISGKTSILKQKMVVEGISVNLSNPLQKVNIVCKILLIRRIELYMQLYQ